MCKSISSQGILLSGSRFVGVFKSLDVDESVRFESHAVAPVIFLKEAEVKGLFSSSRKEVPISYALTKLYLTNKRLLMLILYQVQSGQLVGREEWRFSGVAGTWFEIPLPAISEALTRPAVIEKIIEKDELERLRSWGIILRSDVPSLELVYDSRDAVGRVKDYMEALLKMGALSKLFKKVEKVYDKLLILGEEASSIAPLLKMG